MDNDSVRKTWPELSYKHKCGIHDPLLMRLRGRNNILNDSPVFRWVCCTNQLKFDSNLCYSFILKTAKNCVVRNNTSNLIHERLSNCSVKWMSCYPCVWNSCLHNNSTDGKNYLSPFATIVQKLELHLNRKSSVLSSASPPSSERFESIFVS